MYTLYIAPNTNVEIFVTSNFLVPRPNEVLHFQGTCTALLCEKANNESPNKAVQELEPLFRKYMPIERTPRVCRVTGNYFLHGVILAPSRSIKFFYSL